MPKKIKRPVSSTQAYARGRAIVCVYCGPRHGYRPVLNHRSMGDKNHICDVCGRHYAGASTSGLDVLREATR